jgi:hypothetical protein
MKGAVRKVAGYSSSPAGPGSGVGPVPGHGTGAGPSDSPSTYVHTPDTSLTAPGALADSAGSPTPAGRSSAGLGFRV